MAKIDPGKVIEALLFLENNFNPPTQKGFFSREIQKTLNAMGIYPVRLDDLVEVLKYLETESLVIHSSTNTGPFWKLKRGKT